MSPPDPIAHVRANPSFYLSGGVPRAHDLAARIAGDALTLGATRTMTLHQNDWWAVAADLDWLADAPIPPHELFKRVVAFPAAGANSFRGEVLLGAFADHIITWGAGSPVAVKGSLQNMKPLRATLGATAWRRVIAFQLVHASASSSPLPVVSQSATAPP